MDFTGFTGFFAKGLLLSLNGLHRLIPSYGWAIIALTILIKGLFWLLTALSTRSMKRMQAIQPELQSPGEKYKNDPTRDAGKDPGVHEAPRSIRRRLPPHADPVPGVHRVSSCCGPPLSCGAPSSCGCAILGSGTLFTIPDSAGFRSWASGVGLPFNLLPLIMGATSCGWRI